MIGWKKQQECEISTELFLCNNIFLCQLCVCFLSNSEIIIIRAVAGYESAQEIHNTRNQYLVGLTENNSV